MSSDSPFDGQAELHHAEEMTVLRAISEGKDIDPTKVYHLPAYDRNKEGAHLQVWCPRYILNAVDKYTGRGYKFKDRSEAIRQAMIYFLAIEASVEGQQQIDPTVISMMIEENKAEMGVLDNTISELDKLFEHCDGLADYERLMHMVQQLREHCEHNGYMKRLVEIDKILERADRFKDYR